MDTESISETISSDRKCMMVTKESVFFIPDEASCPNIPMDTPPFCHSRRRTPAQNSTVVRKLVQVESSSTNFKVPSSIIKMVFILTLLTLLAILMARNNSTFMLNFAFCCLSLITGILTGSLLFTSGCQCNLLKQM